MPYAADIDMTYLTFPQRAVDNAQVRDAPIKADGGSRHWLLGTVYGRDLLKAKLRRERPDLAVPEFRLALHLDPLLEQMVDHLGLRHWQQPVTLGDRASYLRDILRMSMILGAGQDEDGAPLAT